MAMNGKRTESNRFDKTPALVLNNVRIFRRNFRGVDYGYNPQNKKSFCVFLDPERFDIQGMREDGWNVKELPPREGFENEDVKFYLQVEVNWNSPKPTVIHQVTAAEDGKYKKVLLNEKSAELMDSADIINVNLVIGHGKTWSMNGREGIKAYLQKAQIEVRVDDFDSNYEWEDEDDVF